MSPLLLGHLSTQSSTSSPVEEPQGVSAPLDHSTATVVFWTQSLIFPHVSDRDLQDVAHLKMWSQSVLGWILGRTNQGHQ